MALRSAKLKHGEMEATAGLTCEGGRACDCEGEFCVLVCCYLS